MPPVVSYGEHLACAWKSRLARESTGRANANLRRRLMDDARFDALTRRMSVVTRRATARSLAAVLLGGAVAASPVARRTATVLACDANGETCSAHDGCCSGFCNIAPPDGNGTWVGMGKCRCKGVGAACTNHTECCGTSEGFHGYCCGSSGGCQTGWHCPAPPPPDDPPKKKKKKKKGKGGGRRR
jgi:hypothetical protein